MPQFYGESDASRYMMVTVERKNLSLGIIAGISTGVFWGIPFLVPQILKNFSSLEIAFGRFFFFGLMSLWFIKKVLVLVKKLTVKDRFFLLLLSASGFWFYSSLLFWGVQATDGIISSLIVGLLPISIPLFTKGRSKGSFSFYLGLLLLLVGILNLFSFPYIQGLREFRLPSLMGVLALVGCLALWTWFAIQNTRFLHRNPQVDRKTFASVIGVVSLMSILPFFMVQVNFSELVHRDGFNSYLLLSMALGFGSSWLANWLWNICSFNCPSEISGPLIVSETIFGLLYSFIFEKRLPHSFEAASILLFLIGVFLTVSSQMKKSY